LTAEQVKKIFIDREEAFFNYLREHGKDPEIYEPAKQITSNRLRVFALIDECAGDELMMQRISKMALDIEAYVPDWRRYSSSQS
jgi:hypothetical protein